jgi:plastocyanin
MNNKKLVLLSLVVVISMGTVFGVALGLQGKTAPGDCTKLGSNHVVNIADDMVMPSHVTGAVCDTVTIINRDAKQREIGFGAHDHHTPYDGIAEKLLASNQTFTFTLDRKGEFGFHDHFQEEVAGTFTVQ